MIRGFSDKEAETVWIGEISRKLPSDTQKRALNLLKLIAAAAELADLAVPPGNRL